MKTKTGKIGHVVWLSVLFTAVMLFIAVTNRVEARDWQQDLTKDLVQVSNGKMTITRYQACKLGKFMLRIKTYSEAPTEMISRDKFVMITAAYDENLSDNLGELDCQDIEATEGRIDVEMFVYMTKKGIKMEGNVSLNG